MKISVKLLTLTIFMSIIITIIGVYGIQNLSQANDEMTEIYDGNVVPMVLISNVSDVYSKEIIITIEGLKEHRIEFNQGVRLLELSLDKIKSNWTKITSFKMNEEETAHVGDVEKAMFKVDDNIFLMKSVLIKEDSIKFKAVSADYLDIAEHLFKELDKLIEIQASHCKKIDQNADQVFADARRNSYLLIFISILISIGFAIWIINSISNSLKQASEVIIKVAEGDFSSKAENIGTDEIGLVLVQINNMISKLRKSVKLANQISQGDLSMISEIKQSNSKSELDIALQKMVVNLNDVVINIINAASSIAGASEEISSAAQEMSQGASEQAAAAEEVTSSMEEISASVEQNADNAQQAERIVTKSTNEIQQSSKSVTETLKAMREISTKIAVINEIAQKTDLLAINAGIEAARAGEHGKGFAVVSTEVRKLAENSRKAAGQINDLIIESLKIAEKSNQMQIDLVPEIQKTAKLVQEISASSSEQNNGTNQVNIAMTQLNQVTQQNAANSEELASSSEELASQASQLVELISFFKTETKIINNTHIQTPKIKHSEITSNVKTNFKGVKIDLSDKKDGEYENFA